jgi:predicted outer membrane lipoprotein
MAGAFGVLSAQAEEDCEEDKTETDEGTEGYAYFCAGGET